MEDRIELSQRERDRLKVLHGVAEGHRTQVDAARQLQLSDRQVRRLVKRVRAERDRGIIHRLRGKPSNRKIPADRRQRILARVRKRYADFGPMLACEHLEEDGLSASRETLRMGMTVVELWHPRCRKVETAHVWRERRAAFGTFPQPPKRLCSEEPGWSIAYSGGRLYTIRRPGGQNGNSGLH